MSGGGDDERQTQTAAVVWIDGECGEEFRAMGRDSLSGRECERADERTSGRASGASLSGLPTVEWARSVHFLATAAPDSSVELTPSLVTTLPS